MTFRRVMFLILEGYLGVLLWHITFIDSDTAKELADTIPWVMFALMIIPLERLEFNQVMAALKAWKGHPE